MRPSPLEGLMLRANFALRCHRLIGNCRLPNHAIHNEGPGGKPAKLIAVYVVEKGKPLVQPAQ
jgi:hypothetical protein